MVAARLAAGRHCAWVRVYLREIGRRFCESLQRVWPICQVWFGKYRHAWLFGLHLSNIDFHKGRANEVCVMNFRSGGTTPTFRDIAIISASVVTLSTILWPAIGSYRDEAQKRQFMTR